MHLPKLTRHLLMTVGSLAVLSLSAVAQPLNGTYTVGGTTPSYATLSAAVTDLNTKGVSGPVTFNIRNGNYTGATWQASINAITGASATNRITIKSETNNAANVSITFPATAAANNFILKYNNASYVTVKNLTLINSGSAQGRVVHFVGTASNDSLVNCILTGPVRTVASVNTAIVYGDPLTGANNVVMGNTINNGSYGVFYSGTSATNLVDRGGFYNNTVVDPFTYGLYFYYAKDLKVHNNTVTTNSTDATFYGIYLQYGDEALEIVGNKMSGFLGGYGLYLQYCDGTATKRGRVANNVIKFGSGTSSSMGIRSYLSSNQSIHNNTVQITSAGTTSAAGYFYYNSATTENNEVYNNLFANTGGAYAMFVYNPTYNNKFDYNNLYHIGAKCVDQGTPSTDYASLTLWRAAFGHDMNSISYDPGFTSATNLAPNAANAASWSLNGRGVQIAGNDKDVNGNVRPVTMAAGVPDIGAYEFTPTVAPPNAAAIPTATPAAGTTQYFTFGQDTVAKIVWDATAQVPATIAVKQYTGTLPPGINTLSTTSMYYYTDISTPPTGPFNFAADIYYKDPWMGTLTAAESGLRLAKKDGANPWVAFLPPASVANADRNIIATTGLTTFGLFTGVDIPNNASAAEITEPTNYFCGGTLPVKVKIKNTGNNVINNVIINWEIDGTLQTPIVYSAAPIPVKGEVIVTLTNYTFNNVPHTFRVWTMLPNGQPDLATADDETKRKLSSGLSGDYTVGGTNPNFATFVDAVADLKDFGVCAPVRFNIRDGVYTGQAQLDGPVDGMSAVNTVTFQSENHNAANVTIDYNSATASDNYVFKLNNVSNVILKDLTFKNNNTTYGRVIELAGTASYDSILNCILTGPVVTASNVNTSVLFADPLTGTDNVIIGNTIQNGSYGINYSGTSTTVLTNRVTILNNKIQNAYIYGAYLYYANDVKFNNNVITTNSTSTAAYGARAQYCDGALEVINNRVSGLRGGYGLYLYYNDATATKPAIVKNNVVNIGDGGTGTAHGLQVGYGNYVKVFNNTVNIASTSATAGVAGYFYYSAATYLNNEVYNNVFANNGGGYAMYVYNPTFSTKFDYNNLFTIGAKLVDQGTPATDYATLTDWRLAFGHELNSISYDPGFTSATDLHPDMTKDASWSLNGRGIHIAGNNIDADGNPRIATLADGVPDIGAYEFTPGTVPPLATAVPATPASGITQVYTFGEDTVAVLLWKPNSIVPNQVDVRQYTGTKPPQFPVSEFMYFYTDINTQNVTYQFDANIYYKDPWQGTTNGESQLRLAQKLSPAPWGGYNDASSVVNTTRNIFGAQNLTSTGWFTGIKDGSVFSAIISPLGSTVFCPGGSATLQANTGAGYTYQWYFNTVAIAGANNATLTATMAGDYTVRITNSSNVTAESLPVAITIIPSPSAVVTASGPLSYCTGGSLTLNANTGTALAYQWQLNGNNIAGATTPTLPVSSAGTYTVTVSNIACATTSTPTVVNPGPLSVTLGNDTSYCENNKILVLDAGHPGATYTWSNGATTQQVSLANQAGKYWVRVDAGPNCVATDTIVVDVDPLPSVVGISHLRNNSTYDFSPAGAANVGNYLWIIGGVSYTTKDVHYTHYDNGPFTVKLIVFNACGSDTTELVMPLDVANNVKPEVSFTLYPNPARSEITLALDGNERFSNATVINNVGQVIYKGSTEMKNKETIDVSRFATGYYIIRANTASGAMISKPFEVVR